VDGFNATVKVTADPTGAIALLEVTLMAVLASELDPPQPPKVRTGSAQRIARVRNRPNRFLRRGKISRQRLATPPNLKAPEKMVSCRLPVAGGVLRAWSVDAFTWMLTTDWLVLPPAGNEMGEKEQVTTDCGEVQDSVTSAGKLPDVAATVRLAFTEPPRLTRRAASSAESRANENGGA
jgi:hypothetical protein